MGKKENTLGYLGFDFQIFIINQLLHPNTKDYAERIIDILQPKYFDNENLRLIVSEIKDYFEKYKKLPSWETMEMVIKSNYKDIVVNDFIITLLKEIREKEVKDWRFVQEKSLNFCRQQELIKAKNKIDKIISNGEFENYEKCAEIIQKALTVANEKKDEVSILDNIEHVISDEFRDPIKTGITGIDNITNGGLGKGELAIILAPFGIGKSTILTKIANTAYNEGKNVLQIVFEDTPKVIQRKHYTCWTGIELNELSKNKEIVLDYIENNIKNKKNRLVIKKFPSYGTTIGTIKNYIRNEISSGNIFDIIILDYIDCLTPERLGDNDWSNGEAGIMRGFESMLSEFDLAGWTAIQGNRSSISAEVVESDQIGGSIKKGQIGHLIISVAKTLAQKESGRANIAILKSRFGKDGVIFNDCVFDNATMTIDTDNVETFLGYEKNKEEKKQELERERIRRIKKLNNNENGENITGKP
jgi:replicative DNA helicase